MTTHNGIEIEEDMREEYGPTATPSGSANERPAFTPGPWVSSPYKPVGGHDIEFNILYEQIVIAKVPNAASVVDIILGSERRTHRANARLIAAAPDMYEALRIARGFIHVPPLSQNGNAKSALEAVDKALAKATKGRSPKAPQSPTHPA